MNSFAFSKIWSPVKSGSSKIKQMFAIFIPNTLSLSISKIYTAGKQLKSRPFSAANSVNKLTYHDVPSSCVYFPKPMLADLDFRKMAIKLDAPKKKKRSRSLDLVYRSKQFKNPSVSISRLFSWEFRLNTKRISIRKQKRCFRKLKIAPPPSN